MNSARELPYELHTHGCGTFVVFNVADQIALPLIALARATLRAVLGRDELVLEFHNVDVVIEGSALGPMLDHLLAGRVRRVSCGGDSNCSVETIRVTDAPRG